MTNKDVIEEARKEEVRGLAERGIAKLIRDLIMCKDCRHWNIKGKYGSSICRLHCFYMSDPNFFCSYGEKANK